MHTTDRGGCCRLRPSPPPQSFAGRGGVAASSSAVFASSPPESGCLLQELLKGKNHPGSHRLHIFLVQDLREKVKKKEKTLLIFPLGVGRMVEGRGNSLDVSLQSIKTQDEPRSHWMDQEVPI